MSRLLGKCFKSSNVQRCYFRKRLKESKDGALANLASIMENIVSAKKRICYLYFLLFKF